MGGVIKLSWLPFAALSLFLLGCGVEIAPAAITATAAAEESTERSLSSSFAASDDTARSLGGASVSLEPGPLHTASPIATLASPTETPTPLAEADTLDVDVTETPTAEATPDEGDGTPEDGDETPEASETPEDGDEIPEASQTPEGDTTPTTTPTPEPTATPMPAVTDFNPGFAEEFLGLLNAQRTGRGLDALTLNVILSTGATEYAGYMGTAGFFGHDGPDGSTAGSRAGSAGYSGAWNGEALSAGQPTPQMALNALLASPPHAAILLDSRSTEVGVGYAFVSGSRYLHYWVVTTGIP